jgi:hypothetical protein
MAAAAIAIKLAGPDRIFDPSEPHTLKRVIRGGSYLCSEAFCFSYRPRRSDATSARYGVAQYRFPARDVASGCGLLRSFDRPYRVNN